MKVFITGGTGFVGRSLCLRLLWEGHDVTVLTRRHPATCSFPDALKAIKGDPTEAGDWMDQASRHSVFFNLAGASIFGRWSAERKKALIESRLRSTRNLVACLTDKAADKVLINASAVGYYGFHEDEELDESAACGKDFLARLAKDWEAEAIKGAEKGARVVITRFGIILGRDGGALRQMIAPFKWFVGGPLGTGRQWISWIHIDDLIEALVHLMIHPGLSGPFNLTSPKPVRNHELSRIIGKLLRRPSWIPAPGFLIRLMLGEFGSFLLRGQRVLPRRLIESGFNFKYPDLEKALANLLVNENA